MKKLAAFILALFLANTASAKANLPKEFLTKGLYCYFESAVVIIEKPDQIIVGYDGLDEFTVSYKVLKIIESKKNLVKFSAYVTAADIENPKPSKGKNEILTLKRSKNKMYLDNQEIICKKR